jgi:DNA-binding IclR family transcriptional regulator
MKNSLASYLGQQPLFKVLRGLRMHKAPIHLRGLAHRYELSPAGVTDILNRLRALGVLQESKRGNRRYFSLTLSADDQQFIDQFIALNEQQLISQRVERLQQRASEKLTWMDDAFIYFRQVRGTRANPTTSS